MKKYFLASLLLFNGCYVFAAPPTRTSTYVSGTTIRASDVAGNENAIFSYLQGGVDTYSDGSIVGADISSSAAIPYSKLSLNNSITNADIVSSAGIAYSKLTLTGAVLNADLAGSIADTKLSTISTAGKVSGAALTSLSSTPSGAGVIPVANLGTSPTASTFLRGDGAFAVAGNLVLSSTTQVSGASASSAITIATGKKYKIVITAENSTSSANILSITFNDDTSGGDYNWLKTTVTVIASPAETHTGSVTANEITLSEMRQDNGELIGEIFLSTYANQTSSSLNTRLMGYYMFYDGTAFYSHVDISGAYFGGAPTSFKVIGTQNFDATINLYEITQ